MSLSNKFNILKGASFCIICLSLTFFSCKTKKAKGLSPIEALPSIERTFVIQVCDKFQMSFDGLPCVVYFSDGSSMRYTTRTDGKIMVKVIGAELNIEKVEYDFFHYRQGSGQLLAKEDFKFATRIASSPTVRYVVVESIFSSKSRNLFVLVR